MEHTKKTEDSLLDVLKEGAKELNCLYQIEEILNNRQLSLPEIFEGIIKTIPSGWQFRKYVKQGSFSKTPVINLQISNLLLGWIAVISRLTIKSSEKLKFLI